MKNLLIFACIVMCSFQAVSFEKESSTNNYQPDKLIPLTISNDTFSSWWEITQELENKSRPTWEEQLVDSVLNLSDTITDDLTLIDYPIVYPKPFEDIIGKNQQHYIKFESQHHYPPNYYRRYAYISPMTCYYDADLTTRFEIDWYKSVIRDTPYESKIDPEFTIYNIYNKADTIFTVTEVTFGGITPEGHTFRFSGEMVDSISVETKVIYKVYQEFDINSRDSWVEYLYTIESPWIDSATGRRCYTMPIIESVSIDKDTFSKIKSKAVAIQRKMLIEKPDSLYTKNDGRGREYYQRIVNNMLKKLKPNFEDANSANNLYLNFKLDYFTNKIKVYYKNGSTKEFVHIADYTVSAP